MLKPLALFFLAALAIAQEPLYRTGAQLVAVDVTVRDNKGPIKGLAKDDFTIQDKGKTQTIAVFAMTDSSVPPTKSDPLPAGVVSNRINGGGETPKTATVILFDRLNIPRPLDQAAVRTKILEFLASLKPTDRVGFYSLGTNLTMVQDFDENAGPLAEAAKLLSGPSQETAGSDANTQAIEARLKEALTPMQQQDIRVRTATTSQALRTIARHLAGVEGRKNLVWVLSDFPLTYGETADRRTNYEDEVASADNTLGDANIAAYPMDPRGVTISDSSTSGTDQSTINPKEGTLLKAGGRGGRGGGNNDSATSAVGISGSETMDAIAKATGGISYHQTNDVGADVRKVMQEAEVSYTLGFYADEKALDGKSHSLNVKLAKKPELNGASLRYRKNYLALNQKSAAAQQRRPGINELVDDAFDATSINLMAAAAPDPSKPGVHAVQIRVDLRGLQFERRADKWLAAFDLGLAIESPGGPPPMVSNKAMSLALTDEQLKNGLAAGLIVDNTVPSPPKPAKLRIVVQDKGSGLAGSVRVALNP